MMADRYGSARVLIAGAIVYALGIVGSRENKRIPLSAIYLLRSMIIAVFILMPITQTSTLVFTAILGFL